MKKFFVDDNGYAVTKKAKPKIRDVVIKSPHSAPVFFTPEELLAVNVGDVFIFDAECYGNYFCICFKHVKSGKVVALEDTPEVDLNVSFLSWMLHRFLLVGFNSYNFDLTILAFALKGANCVKLKEITNRIIGDSHNDIKGENPSEILKEYGLNRPAVNHIDVMEVCPVSGSMKKYAAKLHCKYMQELPYPHDRMLTKDEAYNVFLYCLNDLDNTQLIFEELKDQIELRIQLGKEYGLDLRSKSDAQIAELVITQEISKITGKRAKREEVESGRLFKYEPPPFIKFKTKVMQDAFERICQLDFEVTEKGTVINEELKTFELSIGDTVYKLGKGGLHSKEKTVSYKADAEHDIIDDDVESYYPRLILNSGMFPKNMGEVFLKVYNYLVEKRLGAKRNKMQIISDALKIVINGTFGKLGSRWSAMYSPNLLIQVTLTGQLALLMLIELLETNGIKVISANTDGIVKYIHKSQYALLRQLITEWEQATGLKTEETKYTALYSRDINNYIAVKRDDKTGKVSIKGKGAYFDPRYDPKTAIFRFHKSPQTTICLQAMTALIVGNVPIEKTIKECRDITQFVTVRELTRPTHKDGLYIGKTIRWYYPKGERGEIQYVESGNKIPMSENARPLMNLPDEFPEDIDYDWYIANTTKMLTEIDYIKGSKIATLFD